MPLCGRGSSQSLEIIHEGKAKNGVEVPTVEDNATISVPGGTPELNRQVQNIRQDASLRHLGVMMELNNLALRN